LKITGISVTPIYPKKIFGGSQKIFLDLFMGLDKRDHNVQILSTKSNNLNEEFYINTLLVKSYLNFRGSFPATHQIPPFDLIKNTKIIENETQDSDVIYLHADSLYLRPDLNISKIYRSIHDYIYEESILSTLLLSSKVTVVPSNYLKNCIETIVLNSGIRDLEHIVTIPNAITNNVSIKEKKFIKDLKKRSNGDLLVLFPHRPAPNKGLVEAVKIIKKLQSKLINRRVKLLVPFNQSSNLPDESNYSFNSMKQIISDYNVEDLVIMHEWLNSDEMPDFLSLGDVVICPGNFVESFGLISLEAIYNRTPVVCYKVGALRELYDIPGIYQVTFGDIDVFVDSILDAININESYKTEGQEYVRSNYSLNSMINSYEKLFSGEYNSFHKKTISNHLMVLAPWCHIEKKSIYNDYTSKFYNYPNLFKYFLHENKIEIDLKKISSSDILHDINLAIKDGCITKVIV